MFGRKGQGAMEYLMTYGWAILVVMVVGIAMWRLGIFNMGGTTVTFTGFAKIKPQLAGTGLQGDGTATPGQFTATFTNGLGTKISVKNIHISNEAGTLVCCAADDGAGCTGTGNVPGPGAGNYPHNVAGGDNFGEGIACPALSGKSGSVYNTRVEIDYDVTIGDQTVSHTESGSIRGPYE